jgi:pyruvate ferredoxin oxidoreductase delta subunit
MGGVEVESRAFVSPIAQEGLYVLDTASWRKVRPVMDKDRCVECGLCMSFCPVFSIGRGEGGRHLISYSHCKGCALCARECPKKAIAMIAEVGKP